MPTRKSPRKGSLQFWPRTRAEKILPSVNWKNLSGNKGFLKGFIAYKAGMCSAQVSDNTPDSLTKSKKVVFPVSVLECPPLKIFSVRFYKNKKVFKEVLSESLDKELKKKVKLPKKSVSKELMTSDFDDVRVIVYSLVKQSSLKKTPDMAEIGVNGNTPEEKLNYIKENLGKEISVLDIFEVGKLVDVRGVTTGRGFQGPVKRFGIDLKSHKSEKGRRRPGSLAPWHPARVTFRAPMAGQTGFHTRAIYNLPILSSEKDSKREFKHYGKLKSDCLVLKGSLMGPSKRQVLLTAPLRESKKQKKKTYEFIELR
jgi:large subunit ribosomal protein L3